MLNIKQQINLGSEKVTIPEQQRITTNQVNLPNTYRRFSHRSLTNIAKTSRSVPRLAVSFMHSNQVIYA